MPEHATRETSPLVRVATWTMGVLLSLTALYVLSSGPVLATAFVLREATGWDGWYLAMYLYFPLLILKKPNVFDSYIEFWVGLFGAPGPG